MVSTIGLLDGVTASIIVISSIIFGLISFYHARKLEAKLLAVAGLTMFFVGCLWLGPTTDFFVLLITGENIEPSYLYGWLSYLWVAPAIICGMYLGSELIVPDKKKIIVLIYAILGIIFELFLFFDVSNTFQNIAPPSSGDIIDAQFNRASPAYILIAVFLLSTLIFNGIGFLIKAIQATGELRKKFSFLSFAFILFVVAGALDSIIDPGVAIGIIRLAMATFGFWMYIGLKT